MLSFIPFIYISVQQRKGGQKLEQEKAVWLEIET